MEEQKNLEIRPLNIKDKKNLNNSKTIESQKTKNNFFVNNKRDYFKYYK